MIVDHDQEARWLEGLKAGDEAAFDAVYDRYAGRLFGFMIRLVRRREVAEELLQEAWMRVLQEAPTVRDGARLGPWVFAIARNLCFSHLRRQAVDGEAREAAPLAPAEALTPYEEAAGVEAGRRLEAALLSLSPLYREVLLLVGVEGMSPQEAAEVLGVRPDALRQRLARARALLEDQLKESHP